KRKRRSEHSAPSRKRKRRSEHSARVCSDRRLRFRLGQTRRLRSGLVGVLMWSRLASGVRWGLANILVALVRVYQVTVGMLMPKVCRFYPSCSEYFVLAVRKHGPLKGSAM